MLWLTPAMDRLFTGSAGERRRFLDRLVLALEPGHAHHASRYEAAMRARNKLLADEACGRRPGWPSLELAMAEHGTAIAEARARTVAALEARLADAPDDGFARAAIALEGWQAGDFAAALRANRARDAAAGRATEGPHRQDLAVSTAPSRCRRRARRPASKRRCCSASSSPMPSWLPSAAASRRSCCSTKSRRTSTPSAAPLCSLASKGAARCG